MKLLNFLKKANRFVTAKHHRKNISEHIRLNRKTLHQLHSYNVGNASLLKLEFFFYTNAKEKTERLAGELNKLKYRVEEVAKAEIDTRLWVLHGYAAGIKIDLPALNSWTTQMCRLGYDSDCVFDGWRTKPVNEQALETSITDQKKIVALRTELLTGYTMKEQVKIAGQ